MMNLNALKIDPEFQGKIPPLTFEELEQLENQNQALKVRLQQKEAEVTELLSYVEEMMKEKGDSCVCWNEWCTSF